MRISYGTGSTRISRVLVAWTDKGLCTLRLVREDAAALDRDMQSTYPRDELVLDQKQAAQVVRQLNEVLDGDRDEVDLPLDLHGTTFQQQVWSALRKVPRGTTCSYSELARKAGNSKAVRAAASACANNPVAILVPCHRVVRKDGGLGGFSCGLSVKEHLLELENVQCKSSKRGHA